MTPKQFRRTVTDLVSPHASVPSLHSDWIDAALYSVMSEALTYVRPPYLRKVNTQNLTSGTAAYYMPSDLMLPISVRVVDSAGSNYRTLKKLTNEELDTIDDAPEAEDPGSPTYYYESGVVTTSGADYGKRIITVWPTPSTTVTNGLYTRYLRKPTKVDSMPSTDSEIIDVPDTFHLPLAYRVAYLYLIRQGSKAAKSAIEYASIYESALRQFYVEHNEQWQFDYSPALKLEFPDFGMELPW